MYSDLNVYIDLSLDKFYEDDGYIRQLHEIVVLAYQHKATVYYCKEQIDDLDNFNEGDDKYITSRFNELAILLEHSIEISKPSTQFIFRVKYAHEYTTLNYVANIAINIVEHNNSAIISLEEVQSENYFLLVNSNEVFQNIKVTTCSISDNFLSWVFDNVEARNFNLSSKHGENGVGHWQKTGVSQLLCNKETAQEMLNKAIPDFTRKAKQLFFFDEKFDTFIEFYYEGNNPQKQWHGFHLEKKDWDRVPKRVLKHFKK